MRKNVDLRSEAGVTMVSTMVDFGLIALAALALASLVAYNRLSEVRLKRNVQGDSALVNATATLQNMVFSDLYDFCKKKGALNANRPSVCGDPGTTLASGAVVQPGVDTITGLTKSVDVLRDWNGDPSADGRACVELLSCMEQINGRLLMVTVRAIWADPSLPGNQLIKIPKLLTFRKAR